MKTLRECLKEAVEKKTALGHFNFSTIDGLWAIFRAAKGLGLPIIVGVSEGERNFVGVRQAAGLVRSLRSEFNYPIFLNADHSYSFESVKEAVDAGFDMVIFDGVRLPLEENIEITEKCVDYCRKTNPEILAEGEIGFIGSSSKLLDEAPAGTDAMTEPALAKDFVERTDVDLLAPAVGNIHGMLKGRSDPRLDIGRIKAIRQAVNVPLVLHGASGNSDEDVRQAIGAGAAIVHINTELRVAWRDALKLSLRKNSDEVAPYKILKGPMAAMEKVVASKLKLFNEHQ